jgi:tetratricopeptide (TPR) repeat protein
MLIKKHSVRSKRQVTQSRFEDLLVELSKKAIEKDINLFEAYAAKAMRIAEVEGSRLMMGMVHLQLGNAYLLVEELKPALNNFRKATVEARASRGTDGRIAIEMAIQSLNGEGDVLFSMENYAAAGEVYKEAAKTAESLEHYLSVMDGWLMATFCHEMQGRYIDAYRCCECALLAGEKLPKNLRPKGSLAQAGDTLLRIVNLLKTSQTAISPNAYSREREIDLRMQALIGKNWRKHIPEMS